MEEEKKPAKGKEDMVQVTKSDFDLLTSQVRELTRQVANAQGGVIDIERTEEHVCNLREWDGKLVVNVTKCWDEKDKTTGERGPVIGLYLLGEKEPVKAKLSEFYRNSRLVECRIKETKVLDKGVKVAGSVEVKDVKYDKYVTLGTGVRVPMKIVTPRVELVVVLKDGTELTVPEEAVN